MTASQHRKEADLRTGDVLEVLRGLESESFHGMLTDPPYGLKFMGKRWDAEVPSVEVWREALRVLKPGAFALVFGGTRTFHRLAVALEDAGFEIRDTLMWVYGSGFPKSKNLGGEWKGYGSALKPAFEPVLLVRKPTRLTYAQNAAEHGAGALNIDGCRVPMSRRDVEAIEQGSYGRPGIRPRTEGTFMQGSDMRTAARVHPAGRWPANLIHDGSEEALAAFPLVADSPPPERAIVRGKRGDNIYGGQTNAEGTIGHGDSGSAARFFYCTKASREERDAGLQHLAKSRGGMVSNTSGQHITRRDEGYEIPEVANHHPTVKPIALTEYLARLLLPPGGGRILTPFSGVGSEVIGALRAGWTEAVGIELDPRYVDIARARADYWVHRKLTFDGDALSQMPLFEVAP